MPSADLEIGLRSSRAIIVTERLTVPHVSNAFTGFADMPPVFATAFMVGFVEWTCIEALRPYLLEGEHTVGTYIDMSHVAATPVGMRVTAEVHLLAVVGNKLRFRVVCRDVHEEIGDGSHERAIIRSEDFIRRTEAKRVGFGAHRRTSTRRGA